VAKIKPGDGTSPLQKMVTYMAEGRRRNRPIPMRKRRSKLFGGTVILAVAAICLTIVFLTPLFDMNNRALYGNSIVSADEIWEASGFTMIMERTGGLRQYPHFFSLTAAQMEQGILEIPYIKTVTVTKILPNSVTIHVTERVVSGYVDFHGTFIYIDETGMVLEARTYMHQNLPLIVGLGIQYFTLGQYLTVNNPASFAIATELTQLFQEHGLEIARMDVSNVFDIRLFAESMEILLGSMDDASRKLQRLRYTLDHPDRVRNVRGTLDISDIAVNPVFTPLR